MPWLARLPFVASATAVVLLAACVGPAPSPTSPATPEASRSTIVQHASPTAVASVPIPTVTAEPFEAGAATCDNDTEGYSVSYPADWTVAPADPDPEFPVRACAYFGPGPFEVDPTGSEGQPWTIDMGAFSGACLEFDLSSLPSALDDVIVAGYPAVRAEMPRGGYAYILNLRSDDGSSLVEPNDPTPPSSEECRGAHGLMIAGREWGAVVGPPLRRIVDRMATTIEVEGG